MCDGICSACAAEGRDRRVGPCSRQTQRRVIRVVEGVDDEMRGARMLGVLLKHTLGDRGRERLTPEARVARPHGSEQRQGVEDGDLVVVRPLRGHARHGLRVGGVTRELVARREIENLHRLEERFFLRKLRLCHTALVRRIEAIEDSLRGLHVLLRPKGVVVAHRLAPVRHRERWIHLLRLLERDSRLVELKAVERLDARQECFLRCRRT